MGAFELCAQSAARVEKEREYGADRKEILKNTVEAKECAKERKRGIKGIGEGALVFVCEEMKKEGMEDGA